LKASIKNNPQVLKRVKKEGVTQHLQYEREFIILYIHNNGFNALPLNPDPSKLPKNFIPNSDCKFEQLS